MGHRQIETPHLDKLAARSALFTRGYVPTALCRPALASLANGLYAHQHHISGNDPALLPEMTGKAAKGAKTAKAAKQTGDPPEYQALRAKLISKLDQSPTIAKLLGQQGYLSHQSGKWWEGGYQRGGFTHGMTRGFPQPGGRHGDDGLKIGREGMSPIFDFIDRAVAEKKPFFVWYAPFLPHTPHNPPQRLGPHAARTSPPALLGLSVLMVCLRDAALPPPRLGSQGISLGGLAPRLLETAVNALAGLAILSLSPPPLQPHHPAPRCLQAESCPWQDLIYRRDQQQ